MIRAVIFDLDNTLVDFMVMKEQAVNAAITAMIDAGITMPAADIKQRINAIYSAKGIEYQRVFNDFLFEAFGTVPPGVLAAGIVAYRRAREAALVLYPHVYGTLLALAKKGLKLGVVSDAPRHEAWLRIAYLNLHHMFDAVVTLEDTGEKKPSEKPFRAVINQLGVTPEETLMLGDWPDRDIAGARAMGMTTVLARYGSLFNHESFPADYIIDDIASLVSIIDGLNKK